MLTFHLTVVGLREAHPPVAQLVDGEDGPSVVPGLLDPRVPEVERGGLGDGLLRMCQLERA